MLTSADETDLLIPLFGGEGPGARFDPFLTRLLRRTRADHAALLLEDAGFAIGKAAPQLANRVRAAKLRPGRVYALSDLPGGEVGEGDARILRLPGNDAPAWLLIAREECSAADSALLSALAPYVGIALRQYRAEQRAAAMDAASATAFARAGAGWFLLDGESRVIAAGPGLVQRLDAAGLRLRSGERLAGIAARAPGEAPRAAVLSAEPRIEALLLPSDVDGATTLALCRFAQGSADAPAPLFAQLSGLPPREAEFAVALAQGASIAEAGAALGLSLETARNYSKQAYAKLGLRGQADLVRRFWESGASLA